MSDWKPRNKNIDVLLGQVKFNFARRILMTIDRKLTNQEQTIERLQRENDFLASELRKHQEQERSA